MEGASSSAPEGGAEQAPVQPAADQLALVTESAASIVPDVSTAGKGTPTTASPPASANGSSETVGDDPSSSRTPTEVIANGADNETDTTGTAEEREGAPVAVVAVGTNPTVVATAPVGTKQRDGLTIVDAVGVVEDPVAAFKSAVQAESSATDGKTEVGNATGKRAHGEDGEDTGSQELPPRKRVALGRDDTENAASVVADEPEVEAAVNGTPMTVAPSANGSVVAAEDESASVKSPAELPTGVVDNKTVILTAEEREGVPNAEVASGGDHLGATVDITAPSSLVEMEQRNGLTSAVVNAVAASESAVSAERSTSNGMVDVVAGACKRPYGEDGEDTVSQELPPRKRVALERDEAAVPSSAATDETVGDSSDDVEMSEPLDEEEVIRNDALHATEEVKRAHEEFCRGLNGKQQVDVYDVRTKEWLAAKIERVDDKGYTVHYMGWNSKCDEKIAKASSYRVQPRATKAAEAWAKHQAKIDKHRRGRDKRLTVAPSSNDILERLNAEERELAPTFVSTGLTRSGRAITRRVENGALKKPKAPAKKKDESVVESKFPEEDLCGICGEIEDDDLTDMILCDGGCLKSYHFSCLGIESAPEGEKWLCEQCRTNEQLCFGCGRNGTINEKAGVYRCSAASCGKYFHQTCVDANKMSRRAGKAKPGSATVEELLESEASFRCPRHICFVCEGKKKSSDLMCCLKCPESYHPQCVPPSARYNTVGLLCWRHSNDELPKIPSFYLTDRSIDTVTVDSSMHLPWIFLPKQDPDAEKPDDCHHFRLLLNIIEDVRLQPPTYRKLGRSIYTFKQPKVSLEDSPMCVCKAQCGDDCINRLSFTECFGPAPTPGMKFNKHTKESNCTLGENCGNRALHQKVYPRFQNFHTVEKGWGLRLLEPVKAGQLVIEYVGEVINEEEKERRLLDHAKKSPEDKNMYIMELGKGEYIDARFKGSVSRFINHSCDPNCHLLKWRVKGVNRIAITALKDIEPDTELSYDYQFHTKQAMEWKCHCKSKNCRGTMAPEKINQAYDSPVKKLTKKEQLKQRKRALLQERIQLDKETKSTARRLSLTAHVSMGDRTTSEKMAVRTGPATRELQWAKYYHLFNMRDAKHGFNFKLRKELRDLKLEGHEKVKRELLSVSGSTTAASSLSASPVRLSEDKFETGSDAVKDAVLTVQSVPKQDPVGNESVEDLATKEYPTAQPVMKDAGLTSQSVLEHDPVAQESVNAAQSVPKQNPVVKDMVTKETPTLQPAVKDAVLTTQPVAEQDPVAKESVKEMVTKEDPVAQP